MYTKRKTCIQTREIKKEQKKNILMHNSNTLEKRLLRKKIPNTNSQ